MGSLVVKLLSSRYTTACGTFFMIIHFCGARINLCAEERRERREARGRHPTSCAGDEPIGSVEMSHGMEIIWPFRFNLLDRLIPRGPKYCFLLRVLCSVSPEAR